MAHVVRPDFELEFIIDLYSQVLIGIQLILCYCSDRSISLGTELNFKPDVILSSVVGVANVQVFYL